MEIEEHSEDDMELITDISSQEEEVNETLKLMAENFIDSPADKLGKYIEEEAGRTRYEGRTITHLLL